MAWCGVILTSLWCSFSLEDGAKWGGECACFAAKFNAFMTDPHKRLWQTLSLCLVQTVLNRAYKVTGKFFAFTSALCKQSWSNTQQFEWIRGFKMLPSVYPLLLCLSACGTVFMARSLSVLFKNLGARAQISRHSGLQKFICLWHWSMFHLLGCHWNCVL